MDCSFRGSTEGTVQLSNFTSCSDRNLGWISGVARERMETQTILRSDTETVREWLAASQRQHPTQPKAYLKQLGSAGENTTTSLPDGGQIH